MESDAFLSRQEVVCPSFLLRRAAGKGPVVTAIVGAEHPVVLDSARQAQMAGIITPVLIGNQSKIKDNGKFNLCLFGENPFGNILNNLAKKRKFKGADLIIKENPPSDSLKKCHILFVPKPYGNFLRSLLTIIGKTPILVVTEEDGLIYQGSGINFVIKGGGKNQIRFQINRKAVEHGGLWISSELLKLGISK